MSWRAARSVRPIAMIAAEPSRNRRARGVSLTVASFRLVSASFPVRFRAFSAFFRTLSLALAGALLASRSRKYAKTTDPLAPAATIFSIRSRSIFIGPPVSFFSFFLIPHARG